MKSQKLQAYKEESQLYARAFRQRWGEIALKKQAAMLAAFSLVALCLSLGLFSIYQIFGVWGLPAIPFCVYGAQRYAKAKKDRFEYRNENPEAPKKKRNLAMRMLGFRSE